MSWDINWKGCRLLFSSHDNLVWAALCNSSSKTFLPKKSVCTTLDDCLHSTGIEFSHSGMKSLVFDGHTQESAQSELLLTSVVNSQSKKALRKKHQNDSSFYSSRILKNHDLPRSLCSLLCSYISMFTQIESIVFLATGMLPNLKKSQIIGATGSEIQPSRKQ